MNAVPDAQTLYAVIDATWPAAQTQDCGPFTLRRGQDGGNRVSAATATGPATRAQIVAAAQAMREMGQPALFMIRATDLGLDAQLAQLGYVVKDPVTLFAAQVDAIATSPVPQKTVFTTWPPLATQRKIWAQGGIGAGRLAVMARAAGPKTTLLGRSGEHPAGTCYIGVFKGCAMVHALEIAHAYRRKGLAQHMTRAAAVWARGTGAQYLTLVTTRANIGANTLYTSLGMDVVGHYHYRILPE